MIQESAREFSERILKPNAARWDQEESFPQEGIAAAAEYGFLGLNIQEVHGGAGLGNLHAALMLEEINRWDASTGVTISVHNTLICAPVQEHGSRELQQEFLPKLMTGEVIGAYCLTEPQSGSDAAAMRCRAEKVDGGWRLNGTKAWVTNGGVAGLFVIYAISDPEGRKSYNITAFAVPKGTPGLSVGKKEVKLGLRGSSTTEVILEDVFVPDSYVLGEVNSGFKIALAHLDEGRLGIASQALGLHRACLEDSIQYGKERRQFGKPIADFQGIAWKLADMATELDAARLLVHRAAAMKDAGEFCAKECSMAKLFASQACNRAAQEAVQIHGGAGYTTEFPVERYYRDARITEIYEGATDIQRLVISRHLLK